MRKLLLASVAMLGASIGVASVADAQTAAPAPGTVTVRLNGRVRFYAYASFDRDGDNNSAGGTGVVTATGTGSLTGYNKQSSYGFAEYARLYPGFDGVAANGLKYGASLEIRQDNSAPAGGGAFGSISAAERQRGGLYLRRTWGYVGTDTLGTIRLGSTDQPTSLYITGNFENFNDGGWNGDTPSFINGTQILTWPFADVGAYYTTTKAIYLSPQFAGFDFGVSYEPNTSALNGDGNNACGSYLAGVSTSNFVNVAGQFTSATGSNGTGASSPGCDRLSSSPVNSESARRRNTIDALIRYRGTFGGFGIAATAAYIGGSHVKDNQTGVAFNDNPLTGTIRRDYEGVNVGDFGIALTYAGLTVGGKYQFGHFTGSGIQPAPRFAKDSEAFLAGASYTFGPAIVGAHYVNYNSPGDLGNAFLGRARREQGVAAGGTYTVAPGFNLFLSYLYADRKQNGYNFITGQGVTTTAPGGNTFNNKVSVNFISLGTSFTW